MTRPGGVTATDVFAGGEGSTEGLIQAGVRVVVAANHWPVAVATHQLNHPHTAHRTANLREVDWRTYPATDLLWASPSCVARPRRWPPQAPHHRGLAQRTRTTGPQPIV